MNAPQTYSISSRWEGLVFAVRSNAAHVSVNNGWLFPDWGSVGGPVAVTNGRACISQLGITVDEYAPSAGGPGSGGCNGQLLVIPPARVAYLPPWPSLPLLFTARANVSMPAIGRKTITCYAGYLGLGGNIAANCEAQAADPVVYAPQPEMRLIDVQAILEELDIHTRPQESATYRMAFRSSVLSGDDAFRLILTAYGGNAPNADFQISPSNTGQPGWDEQTLESALNSALAAGAQGNGRFVVRNYALPPVRSQVPPYTEAVFDTDDLVNADSVASSPTIPVSSSTTVVVLGALIMIVGVVLVHRRASIHSALRNIQ